MTPVRLGVLGCGWIARSRLRQIADDGLAEVVAVADVDASALSAIGALAPRAKACTSLEELAVARPDAVMISTPSALHREQALALLRRGMPVFVQKPLALSAAGVKELLGVAESADLPLGTDFCYRHLRSAVALRHELRHGAIGRPFLIEGCFHNAYRPGSGWADQPDLAGGGALIDLGIHLLDLLVWLTDQPLTLLGAQLLRRGQPVGREATEDFAALDLQQGAGARARLVTSWDASTGRDAQIDLRLYGPHGCLQLGNREGSFFDFDAWLFQGTNAQHLAADDGDAWQAGPLRAWLRQVSAGSGYRKPGWAAQSMAVIDRAYSQHGRAAPAATGAATTATYT